MNVFKALSPRTGANPSLTPRSAPAQESAAPHAAPAHHSADGASEVVMIESSKLQQQQFYAAKVGDKVLALRDDDWNEAFVKSVEEDGYTVTFKGDSNLIKVAKNHIKEADRTSFSDCTIA